MSEKYGSQFVTVSIDAKKNTNFNSGYEIIINNGQDSVGIDLLDWIEFAEKEEPVKFSSILLLMMEISKDMILIF